MEFGPSYFDSLEDWKPLSILYLVQLVLYLCQLRAQLAPVDLQLGDLSSEPSELSLPHRGHLKRHCFSLHEEVLRGNGLNQYKETFD